MKKKGYITINDKEVKVLRDKNPATYSTSKQQVFIVGSKGIPSAYGGFETFVEKLTEQKKGKNIRYHVACMSDNNIRYEYNDAKCFNVKVPEIGPAKAVYYDIAALRRCIKYCEKRKSIEKPIFYVLACRIGPFIWYFKKKIEKLGGVLYINPDGHEWKRAKWNALIRRYWKFSEKLMVKHADLLVCDSKNIEKYIKTEYVKYTPNTTFIAYGSDTKPSTLADDDKEFNDWLKKHKLSVNNYFLVVGRFVPENNYETMIKEFMKSDTKKDFALITNVSDKFLIELKDKTGFNKDSRIKFVGTVYYEELLKKIRESAYGYFHGHEVGGTNPSLLEALGSTDMNLLLNVGFNKEVAEDAALYWDKKSGSLSKLIDRVDSLSNDEIKQLGRKAKKRILEYYSWDYIVEKYEDLFMQ